MVSKRGFGWLILAVLVAGCGGSKSDGDGGESEPIETPLLRDQAVFAVLPSYPEVLVVLISDKAGLCEAATAGHLVPDAKLMTLVLTRSDGTEPGAGTYKVWQPGLTTAPAESAVASYNQLDGECQSTVPLMQSAASLGRVTLDEIDTTGKLRGSYELMFGLGQSVQSGTFEATACEVPFEVVTGDASCG